LHQALDSAPGHFLAFALQLTPNLPYAIDLEVLLEHARDLDLQDGIAPGPCRQLIRIGAPGGVGMIRRRGDRQDAADRLGPWMARCSSMKSITA
jgi:hypothetical protein